MPKPIQSPTHCVEAFLPFSLLPLHALSCYHVSLKSLSVHGVQSLPASLAMAPCGGAWPAVDPLHPAQLHSARQLPGVALPLHLCGHTDTLSTLAHSKHHQGWLWLRNPVVPLTGTRHMQEQDTADMPKSAKMTGACMQQHASSCRGSWLANCMLS